MTEKRVRRPVTLPGLAGILIELLAVQFLLGMILNLYVALPFPNPLTVVAAAGVVVLIFHILIGTGALVVSLRMVLAAIRDPHRAGLILSAASAVSLTVAFLAGMGFTFGAQSDAASFLMTLGSFVALMAGAILLSRAAGGAGAAARAAGKPEARGAEGESREGPA